MKPILIVLDAKKYNYNATTGLSQSVPVATVRRVLNAFGIPSETKWTTDTIDLTRYAGAIATSCSHNSPVTSDMIGWVNGSKAIPVFSINQSAVSSAANKVGMTAATALAGGKAVYTSPWGEIVATGNTYTLDPADASRITKLIYDPADATKANFYKRQGDAGAVWFTNGRCYVQLLHWLSQVYPGETLWWWEIDVDHPEEMLLLADPKEYQFDNAKAFLGWLEDRGAAVAAGYKPELVEAGTLQAALDGRWLAWLAAHQDRLIPQLHSHTEGASGRELFWDDSSWPYGGNDNTFDTPEQKDAEYAAQVAIMASAGITVGSTGTKGYQFFPKHWVSAKTIEWMAKRGTKAWRVVNDAGCHPFGTRDGRIYTAYDGHEIVGVPHLSMTNYATETKAAELVAWGNKTHVEFLEMRQQILMETTVPHRASIICLHGQNFRGVEGTGAEAAGPYLLGILDTVRQASGELIKWVGPNDYSRLWDDLPRRP